MKPTAKRIAGIGAAATLLLGLGACATPGGGETAAPTEFDPIELNYGTAFPPGGLNAGLETWAEAVSERTDGAVTINFFYSESLVKGLETLTALGDGTVDLGGIPPAYNPSQLPLANVISIPFQTENALAQTHSFYELTKENELLKEEYERNNVHVLLVQPAGGGAVGLSSEIASHEELDGQRLRAIGFVVPGLTALGVESIAMGPGEIYEAIQKGTIDGIGGYVFDNYSAGSYQEVAPYVYDIGIGQYSTMVIGVNLELWNSLDPALQEIMTEEAERWMAEDAAAVLDANEAVSCEAILAANGSVTILDTEAVRKIVGDGPANAWVDSVVSAGVEEDVARDFRATWLDRISDNESKYSDYVSGMRACSEQ